MTSFIWTVGFGGMVKDKTRDLARRFHLSVAAKPDSQDICFVPEGGYAEVVEALRPGALRPGDIIHMDGRVLGAHQGIVNFTVGQRRGLGISGGAPIYVVGLDPETATVTVGPKEALFRDCLTVRNVNWLVQGGGGRRGHKGDGEVTLHIAASRRRCSRS